MESRRQLLHLSGLLFVALAQFIGGLAAATYFFMIAATFLVYSEYVRREKKRLAGFMDSMEKRIRGFASKFERDMVPRPFLGAFWFYVGCGAAFLFFPLPEASAACAILAVGDAMSTLFGSKFGRHVLVGKKTVEGSVVFFACAMLVSLFLVGAWTALAGSIAATAAELLPDTAPLSRIKRKGLLDDNMLIPVIAGLVMMLL